MVFNMYGHLSLGAAIGLVIAPSWLSLSAVVISSLLPDIDHNKSALGRFNPFASCMKHRGHCHSIMGCIVLTLPFLLLGTQVYTFAIIGCIVHVLADKLLSLLPWKSRFSVKIW